MFGMSACCDRLTSRVRLCGERVQRLQNLTKKYAPRTVGTRLRELLRGGMANARQEKLRGFVRSSRPFPRDTALAAIAQGSGHMMHEMELSRRSMSCCSTQQEAPLAARSDRQDAAMRDRCFVYLAGAAIALPSHLCQSAEEPAVYERKLFDGFEGTDFAPEGGSTSQEFRAERPAHTSSRAPSNAPATAG